MSSNVLQATAWYAPHHVGGTEVYVEGLVDALAERGIGSSILTPRAPGGARNYLHRGHAVETYPVETAEQTLQSFRGLLTANPTAIYHQHSWTPDCGPAHLAAARALGLRTVLTVHVPSMSCLRGTMLRFGRETCCGRVEPAICGACWANSRGVPRPLAMAVSHLPLAVGRRLRTRSSRLATALSARAVAAERGEQLRGAIEAADRIVAVCRWLADAMIENGVPADRLTLSRQGLQPEFLIATAAARPRTDRSAPLALLYLGRWDPIKGVDVLVRAVRMTTADLRLTIRGLAQTEADRAFAAHVRGLAAGDPRIDVAGPVPRDKVAAELARHDVLAVPSLWLETGPLVVMEAQAAGLFVLGSRLGGIVELVTGNENAALVDPGNVPAWANAIEGLAERQVRRGRPVAVRTMAEVADDMADLYARL